LPRTRGTGRRDRLGPIAALDERQIRELDRQTLAHENVAHRGEVLGAARQRGVEEATEMRLEGSDAARDGRVFGVERARRSPFAMGVGLQRGRFSSRGGARHRLLGTRTDVKAATDQHRNQREQDVRPTTVDPPFTPRVRHHTP
jgi:hypothetical protein